MSSNFSDPAVFEALPHDNRGGTVIGAVVSVLLIATLAVGLRYYTRRFMVGQLGVDDHLALASLVAAWFTGISMCINTHFGLGAHVWDVIFDSGPVGVNNYLKNFYVSIAMYNTGLLLTKMMFLTQYYRVLAVRKSMKSICKLAILIVGAWSLSQILIGIFICRPIAKFWDGSLEGYCIPNLPQWYINAAGNITTDVAVFALPLPVLSHLNLPKRQRIILVAIFCLGFFTVAISLIRIKYLRLFDDLTYENTDSSCWSITELCSGITCACLPTLRPLAAKCFPKLASTIRRTHEDHHDRQASPTFILKECLPAHDRSNSPETIGIGSQASQDGLFNKAKLEI